MPPRPAVRLAESTDAAAVSRLVGAYLHQTEREKAEHLHGTTLPDDAELPARYRAEVAQPGAAYADAAVYLAELGATPVGVVVVTTTDDAAELKRLWADPAARGRGVGTALLDAVIRAHETPLRLSVWDWRAPALGLYASRGFTRVPSWDERPRLVCLRRER